jgi:aerobic carbon-monoxide dehydrogenase medium subunit
MSGGSIVYFEPNTVAEVAEILARVPDARCLAGGQTLVAAMNLGSVRPPALVSLQRIEQLKEIRPQPDGGVIVGAMATHRSIERSMHFTGGLDIVRQAAKLIAHPAIRTVGTIGGAICHADPAADYPAVLVAADATITIVSVRGRRSIPAREFFVNFLTSALAADELAIEVHFPPAQAMVGVYEKFFRADGDFATVSVALMLAVEKGSCAAVRIALGSCGPTPVRVPEAEACLLGSRLDSSAIRQGTNLLVKAAEPMDDVRGTAAYRRLLIPRLVERAIQRAQSTIG